MPNKHTPGTWMVAYGSETMVITDSRIPYICQTQGPNAKEDARLIAAAPELLKTLCAILRAHESDNNGAVMGEAVICEQFAEMARFAIAKAEGTS